MLKDLIGRFKIELPLVVGILSNKVVGEEDRVWIEVERWANGVGYAKLEISIHDIHSLSIIK